MWLTSGIFHVLSFSSTLPFASGFGKHSSRDAQFPEKRNHADAAECGGFGDRIFYGPSCRSETF